MVKYGELIRAKWQLSCICIAGPKNLLGKSMSTHLLEAQTENLSKTHVLRKAYFKNILEIITMFNIIVFLIL